MELKATKKWTVKSTQSNIFMVSCNVGETRYRFIKSEGINISALIRDSLDKLMADKLEGKDIFKRMTGADIYR
jgi:hypothetical protein